ncbi:hypothetical protein [Burkholderia stabilis]|uniref:hypothetical protein n=1 Tax=Burkholderia stabilis TaxID=95485 RepID=UPI00158C7929|nr:hypothetical protein [Burkholderia stabilis]
MKMVKQAAPVSGYRFLARRASGDDAFLDAEPGLGTWVVTKRIVREAHPELDVPWCLEPQVDRS